MSKEYLEAADVGNIGLPATCDQAVNKDGAGNAGKSLNKRAKAATLNSKSDMITEELFIPFNSLNIVNSIII